MKAKKKPRSKARRIVLPTRVASNDGLEQIFSGDYSVDMWEAINALDELSTGRQVGNTLYFVCCRLQELETRINKMHSNVQIEGLADTALNKGDAP